MHNSATFLIFARDMRKLLLLLIAAVAIMSCKTQQKSEPEKTLAQQLEERMDSLYKKGYMAGHQDDPFYGIGWAYEDGKSDVKLTVGDYPAVMGFYRDGGRQEPRQRTLYPYPR